MKKMNNLVSFSKSKDSIGRFFFFVSPSFCDSITGHAWIAITNESNKEFQIGNYVVRPGQYVSMGLYGPIRRIRVGLFYNKETESQHSKPNKFKKNICVHHLFTLENLVRLNEYISKLNPKSYRFITNNCCHFAIRAWNILYGEEYKFKLSIMPTRLFRDMQFSIQYDFLPGMKNILFENEEIRHFWKKKRKLLFSLQKIRKKSLGWFMDGTLRVFNTFFPSLYIDI